MLAGLPRFRKLLLLLLSAAFFSATRICVFDLNMPPCAQNIYVPMNLMICPEVTCEIKHMLQPHDFITSLGRNLLPEYGLGLISKSTCHIMMARMGASSMCLDLKDAYYSQSIMIQN